MTAYQAPSVNWRTYHEDVIKRIGTTYEGRPLILPDQPIEGGVLYYDAGEAIVVDSTDGEYKQEYVSLLDQVRCKALRSKIVDQALLRRAIASVVRQRLRYSQAQTDQNIAAAAREQGYDSPPGD